MNTYQLTISTPDGDLLHEQVAALFVRGADGDLAILAGHIPFVTTVRACDVRVENADGEERIGATDGGLLTVAADGVTLLSGSFRWK